MKPLFKNSKYKNKKTFVEGILFDSKKEAQKYVDLKKDPRVRSIKLQPSYLLQEAFEKNRKKYRAIYYKADFEIEYWNGSSAALDTKGFKTEVFKLKEKLFHYKYPHLKLIVE